MNKAVITGIQAVLMAAGVVFLLVLVILFFEGPPPKPIAPTSVLRLPWHQDHEQVAVHYGAPNGAWAEAVDYEEGWVVRIHDPHAGTGEPQDYIEGPLWSDLAARVEAQMVVTEIGGTK